jgi:chromosome segregation ATPase
MTVRGMLFALPSRMPNNSYPQRIEVMEEQLAGLRTEFREFRAEMIEFKAEMTELKVEMAELKVEMTEFKAEMTEFKAEMTEFKAEMIEFKAEMIEFKVEMTEFRADTTTRFAQVHADIEETRRQMRVLHEEVIGRLALLQEGLASNGRRRRKRPS